MKSGDSDDCRRSKSTKNAKRKSKQGVKNDNGNENQKNVGRATTRGCMALEAVYPLREDYDYPRHPGEGKTTLALRVVSACSTGTALPGMEACAPFDVIYQTAEDGLGSIDFRAAARSVLLVGRVIVHDKSSLAPEGKSIAFNLGNESGFYWLDGYEDISSEDILSGFGVTAETKTSQAEEIIRRMLEDGEEIPCDEIFKTAGRKQISRRTVNEAKKNIPEIVTKKVGAKWMWSIPK